MKANWSVLSIYENDTARDVAVQFCDGMVQRFWPRFSLDVNWAKWAELETPKSAREAESQAAAADLILVASSPKGTLPTAVSWWLESALNKRGEREGVLVGLPLPSSGLSAEAAATQVYLRKIAHRSGLDYLTAVPDNWPCYESDSAESYNRRATEVTSVLETILRHAPLPSRML